MGQDGVRLRREKANGLRCVALTLFGGGGGEEGVSISLGLGGKAWLWLWHTHLSTGTSKKPWI